MRRSTSSPAGLVALGVAAGAAGTLAMDLVWFARYRRDGGSDGFGTWEFSTNVKDWDNASAPGLLGKRIFEGVFQRSLPPERAALSNNVMHWATGLGWGAAYGIAAGSAPQPHVRYGLVFGPVVWSSGYVVLPLAKLYKPIWKYDVKTLGKDLSAHLVYGLTSAAVFRLLAGRGRRRTNRNGTTGDRT